jgi:hypothetical protein
MGEKDLVSLISEMLRKQDQHSEILNKQIEILTLHSKKFESMENTLSSLLEIFITQFEKQQVFNEKLLSKIDNLGRA